MRTFKIVFMGTPSFAARSLDALVSGPDEVIAVVTQPDRPGGRGQRLRPSPVKERAVQASLPILQPARIRGEKGKEFRAELSNLSPDLIVVAAFGQILPPETLELPPLGCINVHASLLPRWRGAGPIQWSIAAGDEETGISIMRMDEGLDTGPVILKRRMPIEDTDTGGSLQDRLAHLGAEALMEALESMRQGPVALLPQDDSESTYAPLLSREDGRLDFSRPAEELARRVRAFQPWPGAFTRLDGRVLKVLRARELPVAEGTEAESAEGTRIEPGTVIGASREGMDIACESGVLRLLEVQPEGKRPMPASAFAAGRAGLQGSLLGL